MQSFTQQSSYHRNYDPLDIKTVLILFLEVVIVITYLVCILFVILRRVKRFIQMQNRKYYMMIIFYTASKLIICAILAVQFVAGFRNSWADLDPEYVENMIKTALALADFSIIQLFLIALEKYLILSLSAISQNSSKKNAKYLVWGLNILQAIVLLAILIPLIIYLIDTVSYNVLNSIELSLNLLIIGCFLTTFFYLNFKMTGIMMETKLNESIKRIYKVLLIILVSRVISITFQIFVEILVGNSTFRDFLLSVGSGPYEVILGMTFVFSIFFILLSEGLPIMYNLRSAVVEAINFKNDQIEQMQKQSIITRNSSGLDEQFLGNEESEYNQFSINELQLKHFNNLKDIPTSESSIWICKKGEFRGQQYMIRISKNEISNYIFEDIENQIDLWNQLNISNLIKVTYFCEGEIIHLTEKYYPFHLDMKVDFAKTEQDLLKLALELAIAIEKMHDVDLVHGCLKPSHVLFDKHSIIVLNGCGLHSLKKYLSLITGYTNKSIYTAVEHLNDRNSVILKPKKCSDIYSFGVIFYEIITKNRQYRQLQLRDIQSKFCDQNFRPKLPQTIKPQVKNIIRKCWHQQGDRRPNIKDVIESLKAIIQ